MKVKVVPKSDQWNADDFLGGPMTFTVTGAQPRKDEPERFEVTLAESNTKVWRPPNGMASVLIQLWGSDSTAWNGKRVTLFTDLSVRFGKETPGGIRISHMSDNGDKTVTVQIRLQRGRKGPYTVKPLVEQAPVDWLEVAGTVTTIDNLRALYMDAQAAGATPEVLSKIQAHQARIEGEQVNG